MWRKDKAIVFYGSTAKPKLLIQTPSSQKRKLSNDMELETPISHSKTRLLDTPVRKGSKTPAKYDFQAKTKLIFKESEDFLYKGDEEFSLKPPWENQNNVGGNQGQS